VRNVDLGYETDMSTPPSEDPRLPDTEKTSDSDQPDLDPQYPVDGRGRVPEDEKPERIPDPDE
jgi:hypothetical protein